MFDLTLDWQLILINLSILSIVCQTWIMSWRIDRLERNFAQSRDIERAANDQELSSSVPPADPKI